MTTKTVYPWCRFQGTLMLEEIICTSFDLNPSLACQSTSSRMNFTNGKQKKWHIFEGKILDKDKRRSLIATRQEVTKDL